MLRYTKLEPKPDQHSTGEEHGRAVRTGEHHGTRTHDRAAEQQRSPSAVAVRGNARHQLHAGVDVHKDRAQGRYGGGTQAEIVLQFVERSFRECRCAGSRRDRRLRASPQTRRLDRPGDLPSPPQAAAEHSHRLLCLRPMGTDCSRSARSCRHAQPTCHSMVFAGVWLFRGGPWVISVTLARVLYSAGPSQVKLTGFSPAANSGASPCGVIRWMIAPRSSCQRQSAGPSYSMNCPLSRVTGNTIRWPPITTVGLLSWTFTTGKALTGPRKHFTSSFGGRSL